VCVSDGDKGGVLEMKVEMAAYPCCAAELWGSMVNYMLDVSYPNTE
jgi:hypothetical protein